jgi:hypothetical protein
MAKTNISGEVTINVLPLNTGAFKADVDGLDASSEGGTSPRYKSKTPTFGAAVGVAWSFGDADWFALGVDGIYNHKELSLQGGPGDLTSKVAYDTIQGGPSLHFFPHDRILLRLRSRLGVALMNAPASEDQKTGLQYEGHPTHGEEGKSTVQGLNGVVAPALGGDFTVGYLIPTKTDKVSFLLAAGLSYDSVLSFNDTYLDAARTGGKDGWGSRACSDLANADCPDPSGISQRVNPANVAALYLSLGMYFRGL